MLAGLVGLIAAAPAVAIAWRALAATSRLADVDRGVVAAAMRRANERADIEALHEALGRDGAAWDAELVRAATSSEPGEARVRSVNATIGDLARDLDAATSALPAAVRLAAYGPLAVAFGVFAVSGGSAPVALEAVAFVVPALAATAAIRSAAEALAREARAGGDRLVAATLAAAERAAEGPLARDQGVDPRGPGV